jgi:hypothetical protein
MGGVREQRLSEKLKPDPAAYAGTSIAELNPLPRN